MSLVAEIDGKQDQRTGRDPDHLVPVEERDARERGIDLVIEGRPQDGRIGHEQKKMDEPKAALS
jgi:hypothetical protein